MGIGGRAEADPRSNTAGIWTTPGWRFAERYLKAFDSPVARLAEHPQLGRPRRFRARKLAGMRSLAVGGSFGVHLLFYRATRSELSIERVMHGARDLPRRLLEPPEI